MTRQKKETVGLDSRPEQIRKVVEGSLKRLRTEKMRQQSPKDQLHIQDFLAANCFGDYYTRNGLDLKTRELLREQPARIAHAPPAFKKPLICCSKMPQAS